ncbi:MAG: electron transport complex protein RnfA [Eubacteriales bacterium]|jgi:electron transport complex protein RnfA|nr:electron transport complex protein RnfA [Eubacteriales bacterium]
MKIMLMILFSMILINNYLLSQFLGICSFLGVTKKLDSAVGMSYAVIFVMVLATVVTWPIQTFLLDPNGIGYMQTVVFILVIAALVQLVEITMKKYMPALHKSLGIFLPLITTNCAVLGVAITNIDNGYNFAQSIVESLGAGLGYMLAMVLFAGIRSKIDDNESIPKAFQGTPAILIAASILAMSFMGFSGMVDGIFG